MATFTVHHLEDEVPDVGKQPMGLVRINRRELSRQLNLRGKSPFDLRAVVSASTRAEIARGGEVKARTMAAITAQLSEWPVLEQAEGLLAAEDR
jgi:hypothetical protein